MNMLVVVVVVVGRRSGQNKVEDPDGKCRAE